MLRTTLPDPSTLRREIVKSHRRSRQYGIDPDCTRNPDQPCLSAGELEKRRSQNREFLEVARTQMEELYELVAGAGFIMAVVDRDGYILDIIGDLPILESLQERNCWPGYRWTERDVGTSAISLALERQIPIQLNDREHYCKRGHGHTSSASPMFDLDGDLLGVIVMAGEIEQVHPHTLGMVITAARAIEDQLRIRSASQELLLRNNYMNAILESIDSGVMAVDKEGRITQINSQGKGILHWDGDVQGKSVNELLGSQTDWQRMMHAGFGYVDRELFLRGPRGVIHLMHTAKPILGSTGEVQGVIVVFNEIHRVRKLVNEMAGSQARFTFHDIAGCSPALEEAKRLAGLAAAGSSTVLLLGETGTGKELFAQAIHNASNRRSQPFVAINCGAIPRELLESELFGYAEGAFTGARKGGRPGKFELASEGTVFLDEIGDMPQDMQVKLLRVLQTGEIHRVGEHKPIPVDLRVIAATHVDLHREVELKSFRNDLFYRLNVFPITLPPLRERPEDVLPLAQHSLRRCCQALKKREVRFSAAAEKILANYDWPGNVRELGNVVERAVNLVTTGLIGAEHLAFLAPRKIRARPAGTGSLLEEVERQAIQDVMDSVGPNIAKASRVLGITRATLYKKLKKYNLSSHREVLPS